MSKGPFKTPSITQKSKNKSCGHRWAEEPEQWNGKRHFIFLLPSSRASHSFCAKCSIHLAWLIKRLLPRLPAPLSTRQIAPLLKDLVHYVFVASGKVFTNNFRRTAFFIQLHANKDFQSSCELVTYENSKFQRLSTHIIQELLLSILERNRPRKQFSLRSGHLHVHTSQSLRTVCFSTLSNNLSN